jgi:excinuclease ABC subunit A
VIDMGPEGGDGGGRVVVEGTPEQVVDQPESHTGRFLATAFNTPQPSRTLAKEKRAANNGPRKTSRRR